MFRQLLEVPMGQDRVRSVVRITDDPAPADGFEGFQALGRFLQTVMTQPSILRHAKDCPDEIHFRHNGTAWMMESVSYVERKPDGPTPPRSA